MRQELPDVLNQKRRTARRASMARGPARVILIGGLLLWIRQAEGGQVNVVSKIDIEERGSQTVVTVKGSRRPAFSVFKLARPSRLTIDLANCRLDGVSSLLDVDTWGVNQIATTTFRSRASRVVRVMINFRRPAHYDVRTAGNQVVAVITPHEQRPALPKKVSAELAKARAVAQQAEGVAAKARDTAESARRAEARAQEEAASQRNAAAAAREAAARAAQEAQRVKDLAGRLQREADAARAESQRQREVAAAQAKQLEHLRSQLRAHDRTIAKSRVEAKRYRNELLRREALAQRSREEAERLRRTIDERRSADDAAARRQVEQAAKALKRAEERARRATAERDRIDKLLAAANARGRAAERARKEAVAAQRRADEARISAERGRAAAERAREEAEARARALGRAVVDVRAQRDKLRRAVIAARRLERALRAAKDREQAQSTQVAAAQEKLAALRHTARVSAAEKRQLATAVAESRRLQVQLQGQLEQLRGDLVRQRQRAARARTEAEARRRDAEIARQRVARESEARGKRRAAAALAAAEERLVASRAARQRLDREREKLANELASVQRRREEVIAELPRLKEKLAQAARRLPQLEARLSRARRELGRNEEKLAQVTSKRQAEEGLRRAAERARKKEERRLRDVEQKRLLAERAKAAAERALQSARRARRARRGRVPPKARFAARGSRGSRGSRALAPPLARVRDVRFVDRTDRVRVELDVEGETRHRLGQADGDPLLSLTRVSLPLRLERTLDTSAFEGPVRSVSSFVGDAEQKTVCVKVAVKGSPPHRVVWEGSTLVWEFAKPTLVSKDRAAPARASGNTREYGAVKVAGVRKRAPRMKRRRYVGRRIDLDFKDADIHNILRLLSDVGNVNIITSDAVGGSVTIRMKNVPWDHALDVILRAKGLGMVREGNLLRVAPLADLEKEREAELARQKQVVLLQPLETRLIPLSYAQASEVLPQLQYTLSPRGKLTFDPRTNMIIARDIVSNLNLVQQMVRNLDTQTPQVLIEARIVEARTNYSKQLGIQWGGSFTASGANGNSTGLVFPNEIGIGGGTDDPEMPTGGILLGMDANPNFVVNMPATTGLNSGGAIGLALGSLSGAFNIALRLSAAEATGDIRIISSPRITTLDNVEAKISQGVTIPFAQVSANGVQTTFKDARLDLSVKPHVTADGSIIMKIQIMRNEPDFVNTGPRGDPTILTKEAMTEMLVKDGMTAVIGGIYTTRDGRNWNKVPWLAEIPILGWFFKNRRESSDREEVLVFITPRIINRAESIGE